MRAAFLSCQILLKMTAPAQNLRISLSLFITPSNLAALKMKIGPTDIQIQGIGKMRPCNCFRPTYCIKLSNQNQLFRELRP